MRGKGYRDVKYASGEGIPKMLNESIEGNSETERMAARMLKVMVPLLEEIIFSGDLKKVSGFIRGTANIVATFIISMPPDMRQGLGEKILDDIERALSIAKRPGEKDPTS